MEGSEDRHHKSPRELDRKKAFKNKDHFLVNTCHCFKHLSRKCKFDRLQHTHPRPVGEAARVAWNVQYAILGTMPAALCKLHAVCGKACTLYIILQELFSLGAARATNSHAALSPSLTGQPPSPSLVQPSLWVSHASHLAAAPDAAAAMVNIVPSLTTFF